MAKLRKQNEEKDRIIADLEERVLAADSRDGSLFDLKKHSAEHIIRVMIDPTRFSADKAKKIANGILAALVKTKTPPQWVVEGGHPVAILGKKKCRVRADDGKFTAEYQHRKHFVEIGVFETEGEARATCEARFASS